MVVLAALAALTVSTSVAATAGTSAAGTGSASSAADGGSIGLRLVDAPAAARDDPRARVYIVDHLAPGTVIERRIEVSNTTPSTASIALYPAAASIQDGSFLGADGHAPNDLSTWTSVSPETSDVPAGATATATVTISVPLDAAPGEQYGVVWAEVRSAPAEGGGGVIQVSRVGIRLYISVGPGGPPAADFTIDSVTAVRSPEGQPMIVASVHNTGGRALDMNGTLELAAGPSGLSAGPFPATLGSTLAVDDTQPVTITLDKDLPAGPWEAQITLRSGLVERSAAVTVTFPDAGASRPVDTTPLPAWLYPAIVGLLILLLAVTALLVVLRRHRRRPTTDPVPDTTRELLTSH